MSLVTAEWLIEHLDEAIVADVRWTVSGPHGRKHYAEGHIPGAPKRPCAAGDEPQPEPER